MTATKLLVDDKITAYVKEIRLRVLYEKFRIEKHSLVKHSAFLIIFLVLRVTYCFLTTCWLALNQLSWNVLLFSCNLIGQLCLSGPGYSSRTVNIHWKFFVRRYCGPNQWLDQHVISRVFSLAYFRARSIKLLTFSFAENCYLFLSKFPHCLHALSTFSILGFHVTKIQTKKLSLLLSFYFHVILEHLKNFMQKNFRFKRVLCFAIQDAWISRL